MYESNRDDVSDFASYVNKAFMNSLDDGTYFELNKETQRALDILPKLKPDGAPDVSKNVGTGTTSRSNATLYSVLNKCRTISGQRLLSTWLRHPLISKEKIDARLDIVQHLVDNNELRTMCYDDYLRKMPDLLRLAYKTAKEKCDLNDLVKTYNAIVAVISLNKSFRHSASMGHMDVPEVVNKLFEWTQRSCDDLADFKQLIEDTVDLNSVNESGEYMIKPDSDEDVAKVSLDLTSLAAQARRQLSIVADDIGLEADKQLKLETDTEKGFAFKVTKINEQNVRDRSEYTQLSLVKKDGYRFTNNILTKLSSKYTSARHEYNSLAKNIIHDIISKATIYEGEILEFGMAITMIDVFVAMAIAAISSDYVKPLILDSDAGKLHFEALRHPCVELQPDIVNYVPNDLTMSKDDKKFYIITGPNMGGKSTFIKSVAIGVLMAQVGSLVPATDARISIVDGIYTRVGAGDRQMEGISTFMEEMMDMSSILSKATKESLVIIDELGRGTSTFDGYGLAWAISKHLATEIKCYTLFATHFHELTEMEQDISIIGNLHVKAICQDDKLTMLYNVDRGICDESYGINVAQYTKFPERVVEAAREKLRQFEEVPGFADKIEVRKFINECVKQYNQTHSKA